MCLIDDQKPAEIRLDLNELARDRDIGMSIENGKLVIAVVERDVEESP